MASVALLTVTGILSQAVGFAYRVGLTRLAGAEIMGLYQLILPVYSILLSLTSVGLTTGVSNLSAWYQALGDRRAIWQVRGQAIRLFFLLAALPCILLLLFSDAVSVYLLGDARTRLGLMLLVPCLLLTGVENLQKHYFYGTGRVFPAAMTELAEMVLRAALVLSLVKGLSPATAEGVVGAIVLGMALCEIASAVTQTVLFRHALGPKSRLTGPGTTSQVLRGKLGRIAAPLGAAALLGNLISSANAVLIPRLLVSGGMDQNQAVAVYGVTFGMTLPMLLLPTAFLSALGLVLTPKLSQCSALNDRGEIRRQVSRSVGLANLILIPALALLAVSGPAIGAALYADARVGDHLPLLALGVLFSCWQTLCAAILSGVGRQGAAAGIALAADGVQLALTCLLVSGRGMQGYAFAFTLSAVLGAALSWRVVAREIGLSLPVFPWFTAPVLSACLAATCGDLMETVLQRSGLSPCAAALGGLGFGLLLYLAALQALGAGTMAETNDHGEAPPMRQDHEPYMRQALALAEEAAAAGEVPVGCVIVDETGQVLGRGRNRREEDHDPLAHAELLAIQDACRSHGDWRLKHARLYVTLEPCPMCAGGIISARIPEIYYGAKDAGFGACGSILNLFEENFRHHPKIIGHILEDECRQVLQDFFAGVRQKDMQT